MKWIYFIISLFSASTLFGSNSEAEIGNAIVWYDGLSFYKSIDRSKEATLFFSKWDPSIDSYIADEKYHVALQLDKKMNPAPLEDIDLPDLRWLASVSEPELVNEYLDFLTNYSKTKGYAHLILPDTSGLDYLSKGVLDIAVEHSPHFFIPAHQLSKQLPETKKDLESANPSIWIAKQSVDNRKLTKITQRLTKRIFKTFNKEMAESRNSQFDLIYQLDDELRTTLYTSAVVAIDPDYKLPLKNDTLIYLGTDEDLLLMLKKYATVYTKPQVVSHQVVLDLRSYSEAKVYGNEILIAPLSETRRGKASILTPSELSDDHIYLSKMLFGAEPVLGNFSEAHRKVDEPGFLAYSDAKFEGLNESEFFRIDTLLEHAIHSLAIPGAQLSVVKNGSVVLEKSFGHLTYDSLRQVSGRHLYDLASLTKSVATLPAIALLVDQGKIQLDDSIGIHLSDFSESNKSGVTIRQLLAHNAGVRSYIPFWRHSLTADRLETFYYKSDEDELNDRRTYGVPIDPVMKDSLVSWIKASSRIKNPNKYNYSDIGYMILHLLVEEVTQISFEDFMRNNFYSPMGLDITFNPLQNGYDQDFIIPTEYDDRYRQKQVWGEVHDRNAYIFGGVAGHAGLFANASDLAKMMFMLSNGGYFEGNKYLNETTLKEFNFRYFEANRRGLGWDKKDGFKDSASKYASDESFGHTGFTGTMVWSDPTNELIYVFLSNRVYPSANNSKLMELNTRTEIHDVLYESIIND